MNIHIDRNVCEMHGECAAVAPAIFDFDSGEPAVGPDITDDLYDDAQTAARACPAHAILVSRD